MQPDMLWERYIPFTELQRQFPARTAALRLTLGELNELDRFRDERRRETWVWGRLTAKQVISERWSAGVDDWTSIEILSRNVRGQAVRPEVTIDGQPLPWGLSISHSNRGLLVAVCPHDDVRIGVDLAVEDDFTQGFLETWFTLAERRQIDESDRLEITARWAIKEAIFKACNNGEGFAPRKIEVLRRSEFRFDCTYQGHCLPPETMYHTRLLDGHLAATVATPNEPWGQSTVTSKGRCINNWQIC